MVSRVTAVAMDTMATVPNQAPPRAMSQPPLLPPGGTTEAVGVGVMGLGLGTSATVAVGVMSITAIVALALATVAIGQISEEKKLKLCCVLLGLELR